MTVSIAFDRANPPSGRVVTDDGEQRFDGWLGLLRLLEELLAPGGARWA